MIVRMQTQFEINRKVSADSLAKAEAIRVQKAEIAARDQFQINIIVLAVLFLFALILISGRVNVSPKVAQGLIFIFFILLFEFVLVVMDPYVDEWSEGAPMVKLLINSIFALVIFFGHTFFAGRLERAISRKMDA